VWALVQLHPPKPPPRPAIGSHRLPNTLGQVGEQYGPLIAPFARARCPFSPLLRPYSPGGAARGSHTGQFSCFGPRTCFIAFVLDIPNGVSPLNRAVGRAYIRETVPSVAWPGAIARARARGPLGPRPFIFYPGAAPPPAMRPMPHAMPMRPHAARGGPVRPSRPGSHRWGCRYCTTILRAAPGPGAWRPAAGRRASARKKYRGHDERHLSQPSRALKRPSSLVECARLAPAQVLVMPVQVQAAVSSGGALQLEEPGTALTSFTKCVHGTGRSNFPRQVPHLICPKFYAFTCYGWMPHNAGFGFLDLTPSILLLRQF
jgi:hypothetical protein